MKKEFCMSYFNAPVAPIKDADGRLLLRATTTPASTLTVEQVYHMITANNCLQQLTREVRPPRVCHTRRQWIEEQKLW